jgi:peptide/nickel transport system substrate-binding protein
LVAESGYRGENAVFLSPDDRPVYRQVSFVARDLFQKLGLTVDFQAMDWGTAVTRRTSQNPTDKAAERFAFITALVGVTVPNPGGNFALRGSGQKAWFGWPRMKSWSHCAMPGSTPRTCRHKEQSPSKSSFGAWMPYIPLGQIFQPTAFRSDIKDLVKSMFPLFWGVRRG